MFLVIIVWSNFKDITFSNYNAFFFFQVKVGDGKFIHVWVFRPLPYTNGSPEVHSVQMDKSEQDAIVHF